MKITTNTKEFCRLLQVGGAFAGKNKIYPLSAYVKITTKSNQIKIESSDYQNSIKEYGNVDLCDNDGAFFVNYADFYNYLSAVSADTITIEVDTQKNSILIRHDEGEMSLPVLFDGAFVSFPSEENTKSFEIGRAIFEDWVGTAPIFCAHDSMRPTLSGMYVYIQGGRVGYCATDAATLITNSIETSSQEDFNFIINDSSLPIIQKILKLKNAEEIIKVSAGNKQVFIKAGTTSMSCRLSEGEYPPFRLIIPKEHPVKVEFARDALISAVKRASNAKDAKSNKSVLKVLKNGYIGISLEDVSTAKASDEKIKARVIGEDVSVGVNYALLVNCLSAIKAEMVTCQLLSPTASVVFRDEVEPNQTVLLMPMM